MTWDTLSVVTAYSMAEEVAWCFPSGPKRGTSAAMLRWMKSSSESEPNIDVTCTRLSQQVMIISRGRWPSAARRRYHASFSRWVVAFQPW
jgi:hypothetical protein